MSTISELGLRDLRTYEGLKLIAYLDSANVPTIGYGSTKYEDGQPVQLGDIITPERAEQLLRSHVRDEVEFAINQMVQVPLEQHEFDALCGLVYNIGSGNFRKSTLLTLLNAGDRARAADEFVRWRNVGRKPMRGLLRRRQSEMELFLFGRWL